MSNKRFFCILFAFVAGFVIFHALTWKLLTEDLVTSKHYDGGDLARLSYISSSKTYRKNSCDLPSKHIEWEQYKPGEKIDLITIGDSFSYGSSGGLNPYYQDYVASIHNLKVLNIRPKDRTSTLEFLNNLVDTGEIDSINPRFVLLEVAEKSCIKSLANVTTNSPTAQSTPPSDASIGVDALKKDNLLDFINEANIRYFFFKGLYHFSDNAFIGKAYKAKLRQPLFSAKAPDQLLFYRDDIKHIPYATSSNIQQLNDNLNKLAAKLSKKDIALYFMPAVDKYNLYSSFIIGNKYANSLFFEQLRKLPKSYDFIDTKEILLKELQKGEQDIYYADDTHWSWKASKSIFEKIKFY